MQEQMNNISREMAKSKKESKVNVKNKKHYNQNIKCLRKTHQIDSIQPRKEFELKNKSIKISKSKFQKEKVTKIKMTKQNIQELQDKYKRHNIQIIGIPEERKELKKKIFESK